MSPAHSPRRSRATPAMPSYPTHLTALKNAATLYPSANAFRVPEIDTSTTSIQQWGAVTYSQFLRDVEHFAAYWTVVLTAQGVTPSSVVGLWCVQYLPLNQFAEASTGSAG